MHTDFLFYIFIFWIYYFMIGGLALFISAITLLSVVDIGKIVRKRMEQKSQEIETPEILRFLNFAMLMMFWPIVCLILNLMAYLISRGIIDDD